MVKINQISSSFFNQSPNSMSDFESDRFQRSNLDMLESELSMIQFVGPNHLSLAPSPSLPSGTKSAFFRPTLPYLI